MNLFKTISGVLKPKWQHHDRNIRLTAVAIMNDQDSPVLEEVALQDSDEGVQIAACKKINDSKLLINIIKQHDNAKICKLAQKKYDRLSYDKIIKPSSDKNGSELIKSIQSQRVLADIVLNVKCDELRSLAFTRLDSEEIYYRIAVARNCPGKLTEATLAAISDPKLLTTLTGKGISKAVKKQAKLRLEQLYPPEEDIEFKQQQLNSKLNNMVKYAESVCRSAHNIEEVTRILASDKARWLTLDPNYSHELAERFSVALDNFAVHYNVMMVKTQTALLEQEQQQKLTIQQEQLLEQLKNIDCLHEDSTEQLIILKAQWDEFIQTNIDVNLDKPQQHFLQTCITLENNIKTVETETEQLKTLLEECNKAEALLKTDKINNLQKYSPPKWQSSQFKFVDAAPVLKRLKQVIAEIQNKITSHQQTINVATQERLEKLEALLNSLQSIINAEDRRQAAKELRNIKTEWRALDGNKEQRLAQQFHELEAEFQLNQQEFIEECKWNEWANKNLKEELVKTVEQTATNADLEQVASIIRSAQKKWKATGPVPQADSDELWQRFHQACEVNYSRCQELFAQKNQLRLTNLEYCKKLCETAEQLCGSSDFHVTTKRFKALQSDWKAHNNLPKGEGDKLYKKFRAFSDKFFDRLNVHYLEIDDQREANQSEKERLIAELETLCAQEIHSPTACIALQKKWQALGPGGRDQETANMKSFRTGCDKFFVLVEQDREKIIPQKEQICQQLEALLAEDNEQPHEQIVTAVTVLQKKWQQLGPLPKNNRELKTQFQALCEQLLGIERHNSDDKSDSRLENLELKQHLLEQAEQLALSTEWKLGTTQLKELQAKWNIIGPVPKADDAELWQRFRNACNAFFKHRKAYYDTMDAQRSSNFKKKETLVARLENITASMDKAKKSSDTVSELKLSLAEQIQLSVENNFAVADLDGRELTEEVKRIQQNWKTIGPVPREYDQALWKKYRSLLDCFYQSTNPIR